MEPTNTRLPNQQAIALRLERLQAATKARRHDRTVKLVGTVCWLLMTPVLLCYGQSLSPWADGLRNREQDARREGKLRTIELRMAFAFAMIAGAGAAIGDLPDLAVWLVAGTLAILGGLIERDFKRRVTKLRQHEGRAV